MLRASAGADTDSPLVLAGLTDENIARLKAGFPIKAPLSTFGVRLPGHLGIVYGATHADLEATLRAAGLSPGASVSVDPRVDQLEAVQAHHPRILICTVGLPRAGKSTWAKQQAYPVVCPDAIRLAMHGQRFYGPAEPFVWATAKLMVRSLFGAGHKAVILDATNVSRKRRDEWRSEEWGLFFKHIPTGAITCTARALAEKDEEILPVIERMAGAFEPLGADEKVWP